MPIDVAQKLSLIREACVQLRGPEYCSPTVVQGVAAVARHETGFGTYKPFARQDGFASHNWGAQQCSTIAKAGQCPAGCFPATDTSPTATGASIPYLACFQVNAGEQAGALSLTRLLTVHRPGIAAALPSGDAQTIAQAMRDARYYEGFGRTQEERVRNYAVALERNAKINAAQARVENLILLPPPAPPPPPPAPATGEDVGVVVALVLGGVAALATGIRRALRAGGDEP